MPLYTRIVSQTVYGTFSYVYSWTAILLVVVTLGFETGYFRFATDENRDRLLGSLSKTVFLFGLGLLLFGTFFPELSCKLLDFDFGASSGTFLLLMLGIVLLDSYNAIFFAELRFLRRSIEYSILRLVQVLVNVGLTCFFLFYLRYQGGYWGEVNDISYMLFANLVGSFVSTIWFLPRIISVIKFSDISLLRQAFIYSIPLVGMGFFGQANTNIEKILIKQLDPSPDPLAALGIYSACYKIGVLMAIFTQSFRMAFEPFFFKENRDRQKTDIYGQALKYFVYFGLLIYAGVMLFMPIISLVLEKSYLVGRVIIPWILIGQLFFGIYYSLSLWYKVTDRTYWGIIMSVIGLAVNTTMNIILIPRIGYMGAALSTFVGYFVMMVTSYLLGQHYYPVEYPVKRIVSVSLVTILLVGAADWINKSCYAENIWILVSLTCMMAIVVMMVKVEKIDLRQMAGKLLHRNVRK